MAAAERVTAGKRVETLVDAEERAWSVDRRDFIAAERETLAVERETIADLLSRERGSLERPPLTQRAPINSGCEALLHGE